MNTVFAVQFFFSFDIVNHGVRMPCRIDVTSAVQIILIFLKLKFEMCMLINKIFSI